MNEPDQALAHMRAIHEKVDQLTALVKHANDNEIVRQNRMMNFEAKLTDLVAELRQLGERLGSLPEVR
ncbi:unnamed protein product [uncultured bacterium]|nr:unnamed protein product [uncultured bacterium]